MVEVVICQKTLSFLSDILTLKNAFFKDRCCQNSLFMPFFLCQSASLESLPSLPETTGDPLLDGLFVFNEEAPRQGALSTDKVIDNVTQFASFGLRTLVEGVRLLKPGEWLVLQKELNEARAMLEGRAEALAKAYANIECDLMLIGCTGVEDKLQDDVPETLTALREAGIQVIP